VYERERIAKSMLLRLRHAASEPAWRASLVLVLTLAWLGHIFHLGSRAFWTRGIGDWGDPNFINVLLEHWYRDLLRFRDPSSPPMFFPATRTLGYSHGLILFAPFYIAVRPFLHPLLADNVSLLLLITCGTLCLYVLLRKLGLDVLVAVLLTAFFVTSENVVNEATGIWTQRASVFLIPPILLLALTSWRKRPGPVRLLLAFTSGFLAALLPAQDFPTAGLTLLVLVLLGAAPLLAVAVGNLADRVAGVALAGAAVLSGWALETTLYGGIDTRLFGIHIVSTQWQKPFFVAAGLLVLYVARRGTQLLRPWAWTSALLTGAMCGMLLFLRIYLPAYQEHHGFPVGELVLQQREPLQSSAWLSSVWSLHPYDSARPFLFAAFLLLAALVLPQAASRLQRFALLWIAVLSAVVFIVPLQLGTFSIWKAVVLPVPGFAAIRDPRRIVYAYELFVILAASFALSRGTRLYRNVVAAALVVLMAATWNGETFYFRRPVATFEQWVHAPIDIDPSCRSFFLKRASDPFRMTWPDSWALYGVTATWVAVDHSLPTLNGYSGRYPREWHLFHPYNNDYDDEVDRWIRMHDLQHVCVFDIDLRTMRPYAPRSIRAP
jgi:hypothetical protein